MSNETLERKTVIVLEKTPNTSETNKFEVWGSLRKACNAHPEFKYPTISRLKFPFTHQDWTFRRIGFNKDATK